MRCGYNTLSPNMANIWEHLRAIAKHWLLLMGGGVSVIIGTFEQIRGLGIPNWIFWSISGACFLVAFHRAWLDKADELRAKQAELQLALGPAPEVVLEYECSKRNPLVLHNVSSVTAYHVKIEDVITNSRYEESQSCAAKFDEVSHLAGGAMVRLLPAVEDTFVNPSTQRDKWNDIRDDFLYFLERTYQTTGQDFDPIVIHLFVSYEDKNGRKYRTPSTITFDHHSTTASTICDVPRPVT